MSHLLKQDIKFWYLLILSSFLSSLCFFLNYALYMILSFQSINTICVAELCFDIGSTSPTCLHCGAKWAKELPARCLFAQIFESKLDTAEKSQWIISQNCNLPFMYFPVVRVTRFITNRKQA